ncbi:MAG: VTT domain-containing protein [Gammaproteobacteria bacterium]|nr:VTT domain-containing protein [Gammaproteobacteria bacterium]
MNRLLVPGRNCWRIDQADRVSFLIDGENYFRALHSAIAHARHCIQILAWDIDSRIELIRGAEDKTCPTRLGELLNYAIKKNPALRVFILNWDYSLFFAASREFLPNYKFELNTHWRLRFCMDNIHPWGGSHHQKVVVIDDTVAFSGGLDITRGRWDTQEHCPDDPRRDNGFYKMMRPYHDVQMAVSGPAAAALGALVRRRFSRATRHRIRQSDSNSVPWPTELIADMTDVPVAIIRTEPAYLHYPEVREVEALYLDAIAAACRLIYIENQYFTAGRIARALAARLEEPDGPEIVLLLPLETDGWLSQSTMDVLRKNLIRDLRQADRHGRLAVYYPHIEGSDQAINLHAKILIIDDELVRVGSANLNNRSMWLDSECDLAVEAAGESRIKISIANIRNRLLGEHLGVSTLQVARATESNQSFIASIEALRGQLRTLNPLPSSPVSDTDSLVSSAELVDPEKPVSPDRLMAQFVREEERPTARRRIGWWAGLLLAALALSFAWRWTPLNEWLNIEALTAAMTWLKDAPLSPLIIIAVYLIGSAVAFPVTMLIIVTILTFDTWPGVFYAFVGTALGALGSYGLGYLINADTVRRLAGRKLHKLKRRLERHGLLTIIVIRIIPIAPFTIVNMVAGASHIRLHEFMIGTIIGMAPGIIIISLFTDRVIESIQSPDAVNLATLAAIIAVILSAIFFLNRWLKRRTENEWNSMPNA